jgi:hypothetical protein
MKIWGLVALAALLVSPSALAGPGVSPAVVAAPPPSAGLLIGPDRGGALPARDAAVENLDSALQSVATAALQGGSAAISRAAALAVPHRGGEVRVVVTGATAAGALAAVRLAGGTVEATVATKVQALVAPGSLGQVAGAPNVTLVAPPALPIALAVGGEEVAATRAAAWQAAGVTGQGVKVAVIDLGFTGLDAAQASGDLPSSVTTSDNCGGGFATATAHGTAVAEIVHEVAPGAQLLLACVDSEVTLAVAEQWARAQGATIISHSVGWFNTARGDGSGGSGTPDATVADAAAHGALWVNAAGNYAHQHWSGVFTDTDAVPDNIEDFAPGDEGQSVFVPAGSTFCAFMRWDEWSGIPADDYDLSITQAGTTTPVAVSARRQASGLPPTEAACYTPPADGVYFVAIERSSGSGSPLIDLFTTGGSDDQYQVAAGSIADPAASADALAVGAVCWQTGSLEPFSSQGPTIDGRVKPDLVADDRMSSLTYGAFDSCSGVSGFAGTSAAAPTVAGLAALITQLYPSDTVAQIRAYLTSHALDEGPAGNDPQYGAGRALLQPSLSLPHAVVAPTFTGTPTPPHVLGGLRGTWTGDGDVLLTSQWQRCDARGNNCGVPTTTLTYGIKPADIGSRLRFQVTATSAVGSASSSVLTRVIATLAPPINTTAPSIQGTLTVGQTLAAGNGVWDSPTTPAFTYNWASCAAGSCTTVGKASTYTLVARDLGDQIQLTVTATTSDGQVPAAAPLSAAVQAAPSSGAGSEANLSLTIVPRLASINPGDADELIVYVKNSGASASRLTYLAVRLPRAVELLGAPVFERGSGCKGTAAIVCFLDFISGGETTKVIFEVRATAAGALPIVAFASADIDSDPTDNAATLTLQVGTPSLAPAPPSRKPTPSPKIPPTRRTSSGKKINGSSRNDHLTGTAFADILNGFGGNDVLRGVGGNDRLDGGPGNDILFGGAGLDRLFGGRGNDTIHAQDGRRDTVDCGAGRDTAYADRIDRVATNCEVVHRH